MKPIKMTLLAGTVMLFTACGGGGGDSIISVPNTNLYNLRTFIDTGSFTVVGEGTANTPSGAIDLSGTYKNSYQGTSVVGSGETVHHHDITMILSGAGVTVSQKAESSTYMGNIIRTNNITDGIICEATLPLPDLTPIPTGAKVGYISDIVSLQCDDGTYITNVIKLNDAGGGNAEISLISNTYASQGGALEYSETSDIVVTPSMSMVNAEISGYIASEDATFTLYSRSITQP